MLNEESKITVSEMVVHPSIFMDFKRVEIPLTDKIKKYFEAVCSFEPVLNTNGHIFCKNKNYKTEKSNFYIIK